MPQAETPNLPVPLSGPVVVGGVGPAAGAARRPSPTATLVQAHAGARRGLREGGEPARARKAYLAAQWSGEEDRRPEPGLIRRTAL